MRRIGWLRLALAGAVTLGASDAAAIDQSMIDLDPVAALAAADGDLAQAHDPARRVSVLAAKLAALGALGRFDEAATALREARVLNVPDGSTAGADLDFAEASLAQWRQQNETSTRLATRALATRVKLFGADSVTAAEVEALLGQVLISSSDFDKGLLHTRHAWEVFRAQRPDGDHARFNAGFQYALGLIYARQPDLSEPMLRTLLASLPKLSPRDPYQAKLPNIFGAEMLSQGRLGEAVPWLRLSVEMGEKVTGLATGEKADNYGVAGIGLLMLDRPDEALPYFERAITLFGQSQTLPSQAGAYINAGTAADRAGDRAKGLKYRSKGLAIMESLPEPFPLALALNRFKLAQSLAHAGRLDEAGQMAEAAATTIAGLRPPTHFQTLNSAISAGWISVLRGQRAAGPAQVKAAFRKSVETSDRLEVSQNQVVGVLDNIEAYSQALQAATLAGDTDFAFEVLQVLVETDASRAVVAVTAREQAAQGTGGLGAVLRARQEATVGLASADAALTERLGQGVDGATERATLNARRAELAAIDGRLDREFPGFRTLLRPRAVELAQVQRGLAADEVLLVVEESDLGMVTMAVARDRVTLGHAPLRRHQVRALVRRVRAGIATGQFDLAAAAALHDAILPKELRAALPRKAKLRVATGDILSALPLTLLVSREGATAATSRFLIEDHAVSVVPSLAAVSGPDHAEPGRGGRLVAIGDPALSGKRLPGEAASFFVRGRSRAARVAELEPLLAAGREMAEIARLLAAPGWRAPVVLGGVAATEPAVRALDLMDVDVLLFATHGLVAGALDARSEPALVLTPPLSEVGDENDGLLTASEAARLHTDAQWVILSACDTAAGEQASAAGYTGLARAFLFAGARRVVASHWPVRDDIAARLSAGIVAASRKGADPAVALQRSILTVMRETREPGLWAPFMVVGR
jgi:CHAT domain-containing protein